MDRPIKHLHESKNPRALRRGGDPHYCKLGTYYAYKRCGIIVSHIVPPSCRPGQANDHANVPATVW